MTIGNGIAVAGIWIGVGICSFNVDGYSVFMISLWGMFATGAIAVCSIDDKKDVGDDKKDAG